MILDGTATIQEVSGTPLHFEYSIAADGVVEFTKVQALDADYAPVGPCLMDLMHNLYVMTETDPPMGEPVLAHVAEEILNGQ